MRLTNLGKFMYGKTAIKYNNSFLKFILVHSIQESYSDIYYTTIQMYQFLFRNMLAGDCIDILSLIKLLYKGNNRSVLFDLHFGAQIFNIYDHDQIKLI